ncbi:signal transduction histidine kinase regulating citrate/malate metabolism [Klebsiella pneumoniae]|uniref:Signal transduction histidine kinase regulating citrate/malate metabolism n=1 Tax=Klebsiella pneumoniae TaxID=573 RepID=A0A2X3ILZ8_KLEPN|nr:signal transduction histidine kinase regulating citrate/malate metabolism [Klebsiella pneumoniae]
MIDFIARNFQDNHLAGLLIGKYYRAKELGLELIFDPACFVDRLPTALSHNEWISIVGNLLDNAYNASLRQPQGSKQIECLINSDGQEVIIEIADQGCGIDEALRDRIFERGRHQQRQQRSWYRTLAGTQLRGTSRRQYRRRK